LSSIIVCNSHILDTILNVVTILLGHYSFGSINYFWVHSVSIWLLWNGMNIPKLRGLYRGWVFIVNRIHDLSL
jgi:hypothetical protein